MSFLGVEGEVMRTQVWEELSIKATHHTLVANTSPVPEKFHGLTDVETIYHQNVTLT